MKFYCPANNLAEDDSATEIFQDSDSDGTNNDDAIELDSLELVRQDREVLTQTLTQEVCIPRFYLFLTT
jgi:hypothetical protein